MPATPATTARNTSSESWVGSNVAASEVRHGLRMRRSNIEFGRRMPELSIRSSRASAYVLRMLMIGRDEDLIRPSQRSSVNKSAFRSLPNTTGIWNMRSYSSR